MLPSGGGIRVLRQFSRELSKSYDLSVHVPVGGSKLNIKTQPKISEIFYPYRAWKKPEGILHLAAPIFLMYRLLAFKKVCRQIAQNINNSSDLVLVHNSLPIAAPPILEYLKIPSIYFCYEHPRHLYEKNIIRRTNSMLKEIALLPLTALEKSIDSKSAKSSNRIITFSTYMQNNISKLYGRSAGIVRPGINSSFFHPADQPAHKENFVLSVGALWPFKGHETVIQVVGNIPLTYRPTLKIVADREFPGYTKKLLALASDLSVNLEIMQGIKDTDLRTLYQNAQAVLCCQKNEPYGLVPLEAMACGTPVIALNQGGFTDNIIHGETGYLFDGSTELASQYLTDIINGSVKGINTITSNALDFIRTERTVELGNESLEMELNSL